MNINRFFKWQDKQTLTVAGMTLPDVWWSRKYEYGWALQYAEPAQIVADMGTGWMYRPFRDALADVCGYVYGVDVDARLMHQRRPDNVEFVIASICEPIQQIPANSLDRVFCISVLEDMGDMIGNAVKEFARLLHRDGRMILTFDVQYDMEKPLAQYPGVNLKKLLQALDDNNLVIDGELDLDKTDAVYNKDFNLCCLHMVVKHAND